jgi:6-pyruvoyl-tetrahydropterin synthase
MPNKNQKPASISLEVEHEFRASHTLEGHEVPHFHLWKVAVEFKAALPLPNDRLIDLIFLQTLLEKITSPLKGTYLNQSFAEAPTSENMALWLWEQIVIALPDAPLHQVQVRLCDLEGVSTGSARVSG